MDMSDPTTNLSVTQIAPGLRYVIGRNVSSNTIVLDTPVFKSIPAEQAEGLARACVEAIIVGLRA